MVILRLQIWGQRMTRPAGVPRSWVSERIDALDSHLHAFSVLTADQAMAPSYFGPTPSLEAIRSLVDEEGGLFKLIRFAAPDDKSGSPTLSLLRSPQEQRLCKVAPDESEAEREPGRVEAGHAYQRDTDWRRKYPTP